MICLNMLCSRRS